MKIIWYAMKKIKKRKERRRNKWYHFLSFNTLESKEENFPSLYAIMQVCELSLSDLYYIILHYTLWKHQLSIFLTSFLPSFLSFFFFFFLFLFSFFLSFFLPLVYYFIFFLFLYLKFYDTESIFLCWYNEWIEDYVGVTFF